MPKKKDAVSKAVDKEYRGATDVNKASARIDQRLIKKLNARITSKKLKGEDTKKEDAEMKRLTSRESLNFKVASRQTRERKIRSLEAQIQKAQDSSGNDTNTSLDLKATLRKLKKK